MEGGLGEWGKKQLLECGSRSGTPPLSLAVPPLSVAESGDYDLLGRGVVSGFQEQGCVLTETYWHLHSECLSEMSMRVDFCVVDGDLYPGRMCCSSCI